MADSKYYRRIDSFGKIFGEEIKSYRYKRKLNYPELSSDHPNLKYGYLFFLTLLIFGLGIIAARLMVLTIFEGERYRSLAEGNRIREIKVSAPRGIIYDRQGNPLVRNIPVFIPMRNEIANGITVRTLHPDVTSGLSYDRYKKNSPEIYFEKKPSSVSGEFTERVVRDYVYGDLFAHAVGFSGEASADEIKNQKSQPEAGPPWAEKSKYEQGDVIGKTGIEQAYDSILRGQDGKELVEVDAMGTTVRVLGRIAPVVGGNINLSLDTKLMEIAKNELKGKKGAVIVSNPMTGEVLVLYSSPSYDPNNFIRGVNLESLLRDENRPLFNRAISGLYPPGSTFKIVTGVAALSTGAINSMTQFEDTGVLTVGDFSFGNWYFSRYGKKEGMLDIVGALRRSNDIFFYKTGEATGITNLALWARKMGLENLTGVDIAGEEKGLMPDSNWVKKERGENWYLGNTYHVAIGQGDILTTPIQVNGWTNAIANNGKICRPYLAEIRNSKFEIRKECRDLGIGEETIDLVREGMREACSTGGTGWPLFNFKIPFGSAQGKKNEKLKIDGINFLETYESTTSGKPFIAIPTACKTGTAEYGDPQDRTHAWFTVFAPVYNPQISVTVLVEGGGEGSNVAAPIAKKMLEEWFSR